MITQVPKTRLGNTGLMVSRMGCGLIRIGRKWGIDVPGEPVLPEKKEAFRFLSGAVERGIDFFDTAASYGTSEAILGEFLWANKYLARNMIIATKCGDFLRPDGSSYKDHSTEVIRRQVEDSLRHLGDHIHLLQIHRFTEETLGCEEMLRLLEDFQTSGKVEFLGISCSSPPEAVTCAINMGLFSTIQVPYHPLYRVMEDVMRLAHQRGIGVIVNRPLGEGLFSAKSGFAAPEKQATIQELQSRLGSKSLTQHAWDLVFNNPYVSVVLTGTRNLDHLEENLHALKTYLFCAGTDKESGRQVDNSNGADDIARKLSLLYEMQPEETTASVRTMMESDLDREEVVRLFSIVMKEIAWWADDRHRSFADMDYCRKIKARESQKDSYLADILRSIPESTKALLKAGFSVKNIEGLLVRILQHRSFGSHGSHGTYLKKELTFPAITRTIEVAERIGLRTEQTIFLINACAQTTVFCFAPFPSAIEAMAGGGFTADQIFEFASDILKERGAEKAFAALPAIFIGANMSSVQFFELVNFWRGVVLLDTVRRSRRWISIGGYDEFKKASTRWTPYSLGIESNYKLAALPSLLKAKFTLEQIFKLLGKTEDKVDDGTPGNEGAYDAYEPAIEAALKIGLSSEHIFRLLNKYLDVDLMPAYGFLNLPPLFEAAEEVELPHGEMVDLAEKTIDLFIRYPIKLVDAIPCALRAGWTPKQIIDLFTRIELGLRNSELRIFETRGVLINVLRQGISVDDVFRLLKT